ncbi:hypothetical protein GDO81_001312 [Engystomops pustulosus]|uniref:Uncharacterized protein n=1 Tax=Engystomops pustulosus TaxID=76066 RepID=A0AAV7DBB0_ENGPU|nr:hypothetical protein GDO81_001312 [Engystomops pustulosus]
MNGWASVNFQFLVSVIPIFYASVMLYIAALASSGKYSKALLRLVFFYHPSHNAHRHGWAIKYGHIFNFSRFSNPMLTTSKEHSSILLYCTQSLSVCSLVVLEHNWSVHCE